MQKFSEIIDRVEEVRGRLGLNKSRFAGAIDMKPQTYNNFIGVQGSKPNIELISGLVERFKVNPYWLLNGTGEPFEEGVDPEQLASEVGARPSAGRDRLGNLNVLASGLRRLRSAFSGTPAEMRALTFDNRAFTREPRRFLETYNQVDPVSAFREIRDLLHRLQTRLENL